jgi:hypothetical protein
MTRSNAVLATIKGKRKKIAKKDCQTKKISPYCAPHRI